MYGNDTFVTQLMINYIDYSYSKTKGETKKGDVFASSINMGKSDPLYTTDNVNNEPGTFGDGSATEVKFRLAWTPVIANSLTFKVGANTLVTDADGQITGTGLDTSKDNFVNVTTGEVTLNFSSAPTAKTEYTASYRFNNEDVRSDGYDWDGTGAVPGQAGFTNVPEIQLKINTIPIEAKARTLRSFWAFDAAYELQKELIERLQKSSVALVHRNVCKN